VRNAVHEAKDNTVVKPLHTTMKNTLLSLAIISLLTACSPESTSTPQFSVAAGDITSVSAEETAVQVELSKTKAEALRKFTKEHLDQKIQIVVGTNVVAEPIVRSEISSGQLAATFSSAEEAQKFAASLTPK